MSDNKYDLAIMQRETERQRIAAENKTERIRTIATVVAVIVVALCAASLLMAVILEPDTPTNVIRVGTKLSCEVVK
jgi:hypothetical protein